MNRRGFLKASAASAAVAAIPGIARAATTVGAWRKAEVRGAELDGTDPDSFAYKITSKAV